MHTAESDSAVGCTLQSFFKIRISRRIRNRIRKYLSLFIRGLDGFETWKKWRSKISWHTPFKPTVCSVLYYFTSGPLVVRTATPLVWCCPAPSSCPCLLLRCPARCMCRPKSSSSICSRLQCLKQLTLTYSINPSGLWKRQPMWHAITPVEYCLSFVICAVYCKCLVPK